MSLATDILKSMNKPVPLKPAKKPRPPQQERKIKTAAPKQKKAKPRLCEVPEHDHIPGVSFHRGNNGWVAYAYNGERTIGLGVFKTQARAVIALRIFKLWRKRGMTDIPHKPSMRLCTFR